MNLAALTPEMAETAMVVFFDEFTEWLSGIYGEAPVARLLDLDLEGIEQRQPQEEKDDGITPLQSFFMHRASASTLDASLYSEGVCALAPMYGRYAWAGEADGIDLRGLRSDLFFLREVVVAIKTNIFSVVGEWNSEDVIGERKIHGHRAIDILHMALSAFLARNAIESGCGYITMDDLAALARVSEKTIRMAANPKNEGALKTYKEGNRTYVKPADALEWLSRRPDFVATKSSPNDGTLRNQMVGGVSELRSFLSEASKDVGGFDAISDRIRESGIRVNAVGALEVDSDAIDVDAVLQLAQHLALETPTSFARWVIDIAHAVRLQEETEKHKRLVGLLAPRLATSVSDTSSGG